MDIGMDMDIKDFILIGGGFLIALVVGHGFWIAYRAKREPLRLEIVPDLIPDDVDDMERLRGELPNGGARVINSKRGAAGRVAAAYLDEGDAPAQENLPLGVGLNPTGSREPLLTPRAGKNPPTGAEVPLLMDPPRQSRSPAEVQAEMVVDGIQSTSSTQSSARSKPRIHQAPPRNGQRREAEEQSRSVESVQAARGDGELNTGDAFATANGQPRALVREVDIESEQHNTGSDNTLNSPSLKNAPASLDGKSESIVAEPVVGGRNTRKQHTPSANVERETESDTRQQSELLILNVLAQKGQRFNGDGLVTALRNQGLMYGEMSIFHRVDPATKAKLYSIANLVEPGTFDLSEMEQLSSPGMTFFLQLQGQDDATLAFDDMLKTARNIAVELGGEVRDEQMSMLTGQTTEHMRTCIADYARRKLSKRA